MVQINMRHPSIFGYSNDCCNIEIFSIELDLVALEKPPQRLVSVIRRTSVRACSMLHNWKNQRERE